MASARAIEDFLAPKKMAFAGVSRKPKSFSRTVLKSLSAKGFEFFPVNPKAEEIEGRKCFKSLNELPGDIDRLLIMTPKSETDNILSAAIDMGIKSVWVQQGSESKNSENIAMEKNFENLVTKQCIFMFTQPKGLHKFHRFINKVFGLLPK
ncbi:CoA-binding protein [Bacteroidota bacterium]